MIWGTLGAARDLSRLREISSVLIRHGLGDLVRRTGLASALERAGQILHWGDAGKSAEIEPQEFLAGVFSQFWGVLPALTSSFSSRLLRCLGADTMLASTIWPPRAM
jgi:ubiquinone biosynthesis protein